MYLLTGLNTTSDSVFQKKEVVQHNTCETNVYATSNKSKDQRGHRAR